MLKTVSPYLSPDLLAELSRMGHGDEIVLSDAHFPGHSNNARTLRADGVTVTQLLGAVLPLFPLDTYVKHAVAMMRPVRGDALDPNVEREYKALLSRHEPNASKIEQVERFAFYERAQKAYCVVVTGDRRKYANIILKKGVVTPA
jgi:L-fucose mutarotase